MSEDVLCKEGKCKTKNKSEKEKMKDLCKGDEVCEIEAEIIGDQIE